MVTHDVGQETYELCALRIDASLVMLSDRGLDLRRVDYRDLRLQPADDAAAKKCHETLRITADAEHEGSKSLVACGQRLEPPGRGLGADEVIVPAVFPERLSARSILRG